MNIIKMSSGSVRWVFNFSKWNPTPSEMLLASSCIQLEEKERLARFIFRKDLKSSLIGRIMMRKFVTEASGKKYNEIKFTRDHKGKPILVDTNDGSRINFNVSHQGAYTVFAGEMGEGIKLGVDVMKLEYSGGKSLTEFFRIMNRQFASSEWESIKGAGDERAQTTMFCRHWCLKESYVKAIGVGITINLQEIKFKINTQNLSREFIVNDTEIYVKGVKLNWEFQEMLLDEEHCVSVALNKHTEKIVFKELSFDELTSYCLPLLPKDQTFCDHYFLKSEKPV